MDRDKFLMIIEYDLINIIEYCKQGNIGGFKLLAYMSNRALYVLVRQNNTSVNVSKAITHTGNLCQKPNGWSGFLLFSLRLHV